MEMLFIDIFDKKSPKASFTLVMLLTMQETILGREAT
jgi:hypothetical protein